MGQVELSRPARRAFLVVHVVSSASRLGFAPGLLAPGVTANTTGSAAAVEASVRAMQLFADRFLIPLALLTPATTTATVLALRPRVTRR